MRLTHLILFSLLVPAALVGQPAGTNLDESKVPPYKLPDPLVLENGQAVKDRYTWFKYRRPELVAMFETQMFGHSAGWPKGVNYEQTSVDNNALGGKAVRKEVTVWFTHTRKGPKMDILIYLPAAAKKPVPLFVGLNFGGNHTVTAEPNIKMPASWVSRKAERGAAASQWQVEKIVGRGYGLATIYCGDIDPDDAGAFQKGLGIRHFYLKPGQTEPAADDWGTIAAWSWGLSRALDYFEKDTDIDAKRVAVMGHSRLGKAAVWAGAYDTRFAIVISNDSGCGGAALNKRVFGETVKQINDHFPHWFCANFKKYNDNEAAAPMDAHELLALVAPRPLYVASAQEDLWADPKGEFLGALNADPVYRLLGKPGLDFKEMPAVDHPVGKTIGYHVRTGKHDVTAYDWEQYLTFADTQYAPKPAAKPVAKKGGAGKKSGMKAK